MSSCANTAIHGSWSFSTRARNGSSTPIDTELPNGTHQCVLTGEKIQVSEGQACQIKVGGGQARVFSFIGKPVKGKSIVRLQVNDIATLPGDRILVIGDCPELGEWDLGAGVPLEYVNHNTWFGELVFNESAGNSIAYKLVVIHPQPEAAPGRENRIVRRRPIAESGRGQMARRLGGIGRRLSRGKT